MRYKSFRIDAQVADYNEYDDLPSLMYVEVHDVVISTRQTIPKWKSDKEVYMAEDHPAFNFDLWANDIEFIDEDRREFMGTVELDEFMIKHFPHVMRYYRDNEFL